MNLKAKIKKRAKGIIAREIPKHGTGGKVTERFLSALTCKGQVCLFETANELCKHIYELADSYGLAHLLLEELLGAAVEPGARRGGLSRSHGAQPPSAPPAARARGSLCHRVA